jgi:2-dehydropantoate 2-reductase
MRVLILGTGALGCVYAARLAAHADVNILGTWAEGVDAIRDAGIRVTDPDGHTWTARVRAEHDPETVAPVDVALILVKSYQTRRAAACAAQLLGPDGLAVTLQNGLDNLPILVEAVGLARAAVGVTYNAATLLGPGQVRHVVSLPTYLSLARAREHVDPVDAAPALLDALAGLLNRAGLAAQVSDDVEGRLWGKAVANAAINPLTALWRVTNGELLARPERRRLLAALACEAVEVTHARGIALPFADPVAYVESVCEATGANRSSMLQDVERGRPTEIDSISGIIAAEGARLGVATPLTEAVWRLVQAL